MKKKFFIFFLFITFFFSNTNIVWGQDNPSAWVIDPKSIIDAGNNPSLNNLSPATVTGALSTGIIMSTGPGEGSTNGGASGAISNMVLAMAQKPGGVSSVEYLADLGHNLGILPKEAYAQGASFAGLSPILDLWKTMRDLTYLVYESLSFGPEALIAPNGKGFLNTMDYYKENPDSGNAKDFQMEIPGIKQAIQAMVNKDFPAMQQALREGKINPSQLSSYMNFAYDKPKGMVTLINYYKFIAEKNGQKEDAKYWEDLEKRLTELLK